MTSTPPNKNKNHDRDPKTRLIFHTTLGSDAILPLPNHLFLSPSSSFTSRLQHIAIAEYALREENTSNGIEQRRIGCIEIFRLTQSEEENEDNRVREIGEIGEIGVEKVGVVNTGNVGILDIELWNGILVGAAADGGIRVVRLEKRCSDGIVNFGGREDGDEREMHCDENVMFSDGLVTSIGSEGISMGKGGQEEIGGEEVMFCGVSSTKGNVGLLRMTTTGVEVEWDKEGHAPFEAWSAVYIPSTSQSTGKNCVYSGGDDGCIRIWDRSGDSIGKIKDAHEGNGVVSFATWKEYGLLSGGYDDCVREWDLRIRKECVRKLNVGGGAWKIIKSENRERESQVLVPSLYDGFKIVDIDKWRVTDVYKGHKGLAYGAAWLDDIGVNAGSVVSSSFYENDVHVWKTPALK